MKLFISEDKTTYKYIHEDLSETSIKLLPGCSNQDRNKFTIFASMSYGCQYKCKFCYLTLKNIKYKKLSKEQVLNNLKEALKKQLEETPEIKDKYIKLCWMGMGEDAFLNPDDMMWVTLNFLDYAISYVKGLDGVDISSIIPKEVDVNVFNKLNEYLYKYPLNPANDIIVNIDKNTNRLKYENRTPLRFFYSLYSFNDEVRKKLIPKALPVDDAIDLLSGLKTNIIFHTMLIDGVNDTIGDVTLTIEMINHIRNFNFLNFIELRVLRLNTCEHSTLKESKNFEEMIKLFYDNDIPIKVQFSAGSEIKAACGQFLTDDYRRI